MPQFKTKKVDKDRNPCQGAESETANYAKLVTSNHAKAGSERKRMARKETAENRIEKRFKYHDNYDNH